jgi:hypothetical protein
MFSGLFILLLIGCFAGCCAAWGLALSALNPAFFQPPEHYRCASLASGDTLLAIPFHLHGHHGAFRHGRGPAGNHRSDV